MNIARPRARRAALILAGLATFVMAGTGAALAAGSAGAAAPTTKVAPAVRPLSVVLGSAVALAPGEFTYGAATCPAGQLEYGGGEYNSSGTGALVLTDSWPSSDTSWLVYVKNTGSTIAYFTPVVDCR